MSEFYCEDHELGPTGPLCPVCRINALTAERDGLLRERDDLRNPVEGELDMYDGSYVRRLERERDALRAKADVLREQLASSVRDVKAVLETNHGLREERDHAREIADALYARERGLRAALEKAHACATLRDDGMCAGCFVSAALGRPDLDDPSGS
jgi:hypothetical protein